MSYQPKARTAAWQPTEDQTPEHLRRYQLLVRGGDPLAISREQYEYVGERMLLHVPGDVIQLSNHSDMTLRIADVRRVERDYAQEAAERKQVVEATTKQLELVKRRDRMSECKAQFSIEKEINREAMRHADWAKKITSRTWREKCRDALRATGDNFCDHRQKLCFCEPGFRGKAVVMPAGVFG